MGSGFTQLGNKLNEKNRQQQKSTTKKYFKQRGYKGSGVEKRELIDEMGANTNRQAALSRQILMLVIFAGVGIVVLLYFINRGMQAQYEKQNIIEQQREEQHSRVSNDENYQFFVKEGDSYLRQGQYSRAQSAYQRAIQFNADGKMANLGLTKVLLWQCATADNNCDAANQYYDVLMNSKVLTPAEIDELNDLKRRGQDD